MSTNGTTDTKALQEINGSKPRIPWIDTRPLLLGVARAAIRFMYRVEVRGAENIPAQGGALFAANHIAASDAFVINATLEEPLRIMMLRTVYEGPLNAMFRAGRAIPVAGKDDPQRTEAALEEAAHALRSEERLLIFPEGARTRDGVMGVFRRGVERIMAKVGDPNVPIVPVRLDGLWGSKFSFHPKVSMLQSILRWRRTVTITYGEPLPGNSSIEEIRAAVVALGETGASGSSSGGGNGERYADWFEVARWAETA